MSFQSVPPSDGEYRIKVLDSNKYVEYDPGKGTWIKLADLNTSSDKQKFNITRIQGTNCYAIISCFDDNGLYRYKTSETYWGYGYVRGKDSGSDRWTFIQGTQSGKQFAKIKLDSEDDVWDSDSSLSDGCVHFYKDKSRFVFQLVDNQDSPIPPTTNVPTNEKTFQKSFFSLDVPGAKSLGPYDIIVIGSGIGGGIVSTDLFDTNSMLGKNAKNVLVIEKGDLVFHSHCLNAARPSGLGEDRGQQNDTFFAAFRDDYNLSPQTVKKDWKGGPMYNLGGRSAAWGLFAPRIHDEVLRKEFPTTVYNDLLWTYYIEAEKLMMLSEPETKTIHQNLMERLNIEAQPAVQWQWGRIASEFRDTRNFDFADGAYSTIDRLLEIAMSKPVDANGRLREHDNFKILLNTEVRKLGWDASNSKRVNGVWVRTRDGKDDFIPLRTGGQVVVAAGTVYSPAILLRSGVDLKSNGGLHVTDHDIFFRALPFEYNDPKNREVVGAMKLQTYVRTSNNEITLANMSLDASSFLPRRDIQLNDYPKWIISFIRQTPLNQSNIVEMVNDEPVVTINRVKPFNMQDPTIQELKRLTSNATDVLQKALKLTFLEDPALRNSEYFKTLELGGVAHELGTIPMQSPSTTSYCVDTNLKLSGYEGVYVSDLSIFPMSPEVNPTLTLAALALRLSRQILHPRLIIYSPSGNITTESADRDTVYVINQTGVKQKVFLGNRAGVYNDGKDGTAVLGPGDSESWKRRSGTAEALSVFKLRYNSPTEFSDSPSVILANPGRICPLL
ncbi:unnamed protein product [Somion occarium]|uniref:Uncharacterized protein n=1 Tax=Somion occarium TaxID=3059160 RepID=A0ABP1DWX2_9APHY